MRRSATTLAIALAACAVAPADSPERSAQSCVVASVGDGDSFRCQPDGARVRLLLIDAPELAQRPWGDSARLALHRLMPPGTTIRLERDVRSTDQFGRALAYAWLEDGRMVNEEMARAGYALVLVYPPDVRYIERIRTAVADAREARRGLWSVEAFACMPVDFRARRCR
jgi:micrococcal nuclease